MQKTISLIAAVDAHGGFAKNGQIPWYYREDFQWFKNRTENHVCIMGRKTYEDIDARMKARAAANAKEGELVLPSTSVLPNRQCFVVSSTLTELPNATVLKCWRAFHHHVDVDDPREVFVIGGGALFTECISIAQRVMLTMINQDYDCDQFFPVKYLTEHFNPSQRFKAEGQPDLRFFVWTRTPGR